MNRTIIIASVLVAFLPASGMAFANDVADAAMRGDREALRRLLAEGADVDGTQVDGATALHWAVYRDDLGTAELLIREEASPDAANREGATPLAMAALYGNAAMIELLIEAGADPHRRGPYGQTTLMLASRNGGTDAIRTLLAAGVDPNAEESLRGTTALMWAVVERNSQAVQVLIEGGANVAAYSGAAGIPRPYMSSTVDTLTPFDTVGDRLLRQDQERAAAEAGESVAPPGGRGAGRGAPGGGGRGGRGAALGRGGGIAPPPGGTPASAANAAPSDDEERIAGAPGSGGGGLTALTLAAREGDLNSTRALLEGGADLNQVTFFGWSPLLVATQNRHYRLGEFLIGSGADVNLANAHGWTPLYIATDNRNIEGGDYPVPRPDMDHLDFIRLLLENGADVNARVTDGEPKSHSTLTRTIFTMQWFFEEGATPLVRAAQSGDLALIRLLLDHGADPLIPTSYGDTALSAAAGIGWVDGVTHEWSAEESVEVVGLLLELGLDPNSANADYRTPLMAAANKGRVEVVQLLVDAGARLDTRDQGSRDTKNVDLSGRGGWQAIDYADGLVRVGVQSAPARPEASALLREMMTARGLPVPPPNRTLDDYICAVEGPLCQDPADR